MILLGLLPLFALLLLAEAVPPAGRSPGARFLLGLVVWGVLIVVVTEGLSLVGLLQPAWLTGFWILAVAALALALLRRDAAVGDLPRALASWQREHGLVATAILGLCAVTLVIGFVAPPNTWDSLTYHMARVVNWMQHGSVAHYSTDIDRQLYMPPFAGFPILHFQMLSGGDRFANLLQWLAMVGCLVGVSLIAGRLGASRDGQLLAVVVAAILPTGILQSTTTQTDYVVALWMVVAVCFLLSDLEVDRAWYRVPGGLSIGLAVLTKPTAYVFLAPFLLWYFTVKFRRDWRKGLAATVLISALALVLNLGHYVRNVEWNDNPFGPAHVIDDHTPKLRELDGAIFHTVMNLTSHLGTRKRWNAELTEVLRAGFDELGIDVDKVTSGRGLPPLRRLNTHDDFAGNLLHTLMILASLGLVLSEVPPNFGPVSMPLY